jgi:hypothetical protein
MILNPRLLLLDEATCAVSPLHTSQHLILNPNAHTPSLLLWLERSSQVGRILAWQLRTRLGE